MISLIPLFFFLILFLYSYKKRGLDVGTYVTLLYLTISFFSYLGITLDVFDRNRMHPSFISTIVYCILLFCILFPLYKFSNKRIADIVVKNIGALDGITYLFFFCLLFSLITKWDNMLFILLSDDWDNLRVMAVTEGLFADKSSGGVLSHMFGIINNIFSSASYVMFPVFYISIIKHKPWWYILIAFLGTLNVLVDGILTIDRSCAFKWLIFMGLNIVLFKDHLSSKMKALIAPITISFVAIVGVYFIIVTIARFENTDEGAKNNFIRYAGQPYVNFCYMYENLDNHEGINTKYLFPATHFYILNDYKGNLDRQIEVSSKSGVDCNNLYTVLGSFVVDSNAPGPFLFVILYLTLFLPFGNKFKGKITFTKFLTYYFVILIPTYGIIAYLYVSPLLTISVLLLLAYSSICRI